MTHQTDRERLDAIRPPCPVTQKSCERPECSEHCTYGDRLAALEHERDELKDWQANTTVALGREGGSFFADVPQHIRELKQRAEQAEAALLSLQTAVRDVVTELRDLRVSPYTVAEQWADRLAALLPDPAGTQL